ncbi:NAD(P)-dependent oxidoreductase [Macrococcoides bohemicum]|uniref:NAD(P)-dependent oxidoreductase n=1 Tax=Macrococcoides bohemicum TaxID=1903056 RepID=UPI00165D62D2|nr:NAD(P)H-binding protein [Macrococcus bohemicus]MBC9875694.1 NAD(P)H-binding protein [Macrococcus bohemicus]
MKIAVIEANGKAGQLIVKEGIKRELDLTAIVRGKNKSNASNVLIKDVLELDKKDLENFDVIVSAVGGWTHKTSEIILDSVVHLSNLLENKDTRLLIVGGANSLYINPDHTKTVADITKFPEELVPVVKAHDRTLATLRRNKNVKWTYISPAGDFQAEGERTGKYILGGEEFTCFKYIYLHSWFVTYDLLCVG